MPEHVGIGQLPAGNMNFADGGIVAFGSGGDVPRYNGSQGSLLAGTEYGIPGMVGGDLATQSGALAANEARSRYAAAVQRLQSFGLRQRQQDPAGYQAAVSDADAAKAALDSAQGVNQAWNARREAALRNPDDMPAGALRQSMAPSFGPAAFAGAGSAAEQAAINAALKTAGTAPTAAVPKADTGAAGAKGPGQRVPPAGGPGASTAPAGLTALPVMQSPSQIYQAAQESVPLVDPAAAQREELGQELLSGAQRRAKTLKEDIAGEGDVFAGRAERIGQREAKLKDYESTNQNLALLNAGLAVMSTPGGLATAIGKGARVGTEQYAAGLDKIRAAQERLEEARDNLDTLRLNRADMNKKDIRAAEADIDRAKVDAKKLGIEGIMAASDLRQKQASDLFKGVLDQEKTRYTVAGELQGRQIAANATMAAANAPGSQERLFARLGGGDVAKGLRAYSDIMGPEGKGQAAILQKFATLEGQTTLRAMEASDNPQDRALAQSIRAQLQSLMLAPTSSPGAGPVRP